MKKIIAVNASPRSGWNTDLLVREAALGAQSEGAEVEVVDLYRLDKFTGCVSCFGCKTEAHEGECVCKDGLSAVLEKIRSADGLILGTPNYLGETSAGFRALYERLVFQYITYQIERPSSNTRPIPVVFLMTCNGPEEAFTDLVGGYKRMLETFIGPTETMVSGKTLQIPDYERFHWTLFDAEERRVRRQTVFPQEKKQAFRLGAKLAK